MGVARLSSMGPLLVALGCGARSELSIGGQPVGGEGGSGGGGSVVVPVDPEVDCPLGCTAEACLPAVLVDDVPVGWHTIVDGNVYYTTAKPDGDNGLFRVGGCGGEPQLLLANEQFLGYGAVIGDEVFVTTGNPTETVRLPKGGGAPTLFHSDVGDVVTTRGIYAPSYGDDVVLVRYHFDHSFGFYSLDEDGDLVSSITNLPDPDYDAKPSEGFGFLPNLPADGGFTGSSFGVYGGVSVPLSPIPVTGPLVANGEWVYFTGAPASGVSQHYELSTGANPETIPILGESSGFILAIADGVLFGASQAYAEHQGSVWHARPEDAEPTSVFRSGQFVQDVVPAGQSLYVRTERRLVRVPELCPEGTPAPCVELD